MMRVTAVALLVALACVEVSQGLELLILHANDMHAHFEQGNRLSGRCSPVEAAKNLCYGGYGRVSTIIKRARAQAAAGTGPPVLVLNAGDNFQGTVYYTIFKWRMVTNMTNLLHFDVLSLGNHEFDDGIAGLVPFLKSVKAPVVAANLDLTATPELRPFLRNSVVLDVQGTQIGIIGYLTPETVNASRSVGVVFKEEVAALQAEAKALAARGVKVIIALGHSGYPKDKDIAEKVPEVDLVVGGHSHSFLYTGSPPDVDVPVGPYPTFVTQPSGRVVPVVQASAFTRYLGRIKVKFDSNGEIASQKDVDGSPVLLDSSIQEDPVVLRELESWRSQIDSKLAEPIGSLLSVLDSTDCRALECNSGNLVTDAFIYYRAVRYRGGSGWTDAPISVQNGGNIRTSIDARERNGTVILRDVMDMCPFENYLVLLKINGSILLKMLEHSVWNYDSTRQYNKGGFLQMSGLYVTYDVRAPQGARVVSAHARCGDCSVPSYAPVNPSQVYTVLINDFLVSGGDGYWMLKHSISTETLDVTGYAVLTDYFKNFSPLFPDVVGRITFVDPCGGKSGATLRYTINKHNTVLLVLCFAWLSRIFCTVK